MLSGVLFFLVIGIKKFAAMTWEPDSAGLTQIIELLGQSQSPDTETQRIVQGVCIVTFVCACGLMSMHIMI